MKKLLKQGFTLTELMIVVAIIGILSAIAAPMYQKYIRKSRTSEAVSNLGTIAMYEETYFSEADSYVSADPNPATVPSGSSNLTRGLFNSGTAGWSLLGRVMPHNTPLYFQYEVVAGQYTSATTATATTGGTGRLLAPTYTGVTASASGCGSPTSGTLPSASTLGVPATPSSNWFFARAIGNQKTNSGTDLCSLFIKVIDRSDLYIENETE